MKTIFIALSLFTILFVVKEDIFQGTIANAYEEKNSSCSEPIQLSYVMIQTLIGDTAEKIVMQYPSVIDMPLQIKLNDFYQLNPQYVQQPIRQNQLVKVPIYSAPDGCEHIE